MSYQKHIEKKGDYLLIRYTGSLAAKDLPKGRNVFQDLATLCRSEGCKKALLDSRELSIDLETMNLFHLGFDLGTVSDQNIRFAMLGTKEQIPDKFMENVAVNRGAMMRSFIDESEAIAWLSKT